MQSSNSSSPSVVSTEIHSDDSDKTTQRKLRVREVESFLRLEQSLKEEQELDKGENQSRKRKYHSYDDGQPESSKKK